MFDLQLSFLKCYESKFTKAVIDCIKYLIFEAGNDITAYSLLRPFVNFCQKKVQRPQEVIEAELGSIDVNIDFLTSTIEVGSKIDLPQYVDISINLTKHSNIIIVQRAILSLGKIDYLGNSKLINKSFKSILKAETNKGNDKISSASLRSLFWIFLQDDSHEQDLLAFINNHTKSIAARIT